MRLWKEYFQNNSLWLTWVATLHDKTTARQVSTPQVGRIQAQVFINFNDGNIGVGILQNTAGEIILVHNNGVHSRVRFCVVRIGVRKIRISNFLQQLPKEELDNYIRSVNRCKRRRMVKCMQLWSVRRSKNITYRPNFIVVLLLPSTIRPFGLYQFKSN